ncbi:MAG: DUF4215 domain-containing protein [Polyangiaceae bacterium]|nr:DUF4215 domain-containing protein [Polyangiaceae bacterium]
MKFLKTLTGSALIAGLFVAGGCELIVAPDRSQIGNGGDAGAAGSAGSPVCTPVDDGNDCTDDVCENNMPVSKPLEAGTACSTGICDGNGVCVECLETADCNDPLKTCKMNTCIDVTCMDTELNGTETDVDCGGATCMPCADSLTCIVASDCQSGVCEDDGGGALKCIPAACDDTVKNGTETDVDCGGSCAPTQKCADTQACAVPEDCVSGVCTNSVCAVPTCGDGVVNAMGEACDDGNDVDGDMCDTNCTIPGCGNGIVVAPEECDDMNMVNGDGCDINCTVSACGNGQVGGTETCDDGNKANGDGCDDGPGGNCTATACGNGVVTGMEVCDDGNQTNGDGCDEGANGNCTVTACGNGIVTGTEVCDDGNNTNADGCDDGANGNCTVSACGNGVLAGTEGCDDGNTTDNDGCDSNCTATGCGNGVVTGTEVCDTGNNANGDGCDDGPGGNCTATACGNGVTTGTEACDDGNTMSGDMCDSNCTIPGCGNGVIVAPEVCDDNNTTNGDGCDSNCTVTACGNGIVTMGETCDDNNTTNGDGCDANCKPTGCGNGIATAGETCDDNNTTGGDGCSATCATENLESEPNNACGAEDGPFTPNPTVNVIGAITPAADQDFFSFTLPGPGVQSIKIESFSGVVPGACAGGIDTFLELRGTNCTTVLASDDDDGLNFCSLIDAAGADTAARKLAPGTYFVRMNELGDNATIANYNITVTILSTCGNGGAPEPTEACDDGNTTSGDGCDANCTVSVCGNGVKAGAEGCDDGNTTNGDGCSSTCVVEAGYNCTGTQPSVCTGVCGDGIIQFNEGCEDGNTTSGDCCSATCQVEACESEPNSTCPADADTIGAFALNPKIAYGGGAITPSGDIDFYSFTLTKPASVKVESFTTKVGQCTADTLVELRASNCSTIIISDDDDGVNNCSLINPTTDTAARNLAAGQYFVRVAAFSGTIASYGVAVTLVDECGNGTKGAFEACDDNNNTNGDGCSATCTVETGFNCVGTTPSVCTTTCGDGIKAGAEGCDDAPPAENGDGCSAGCAVEAGYTCTGTAPSVCTDNDECTLNTDNCDANATCTNTPGSFTCACNVGFTGNGVTCTNLASCKDILAALPLSTDGDYMIDPDGVGGTAAFTVRCDMTTAGGGWTLVFNDGTGFNESLLGDGAQTGFTSNYINLAYSTVAISNGLMIDASDAAINALNQEHRTVITTPGGVGSTVRALFTGGSSIFFDADDNANVASNTGLTCGSFGKWADYEAAVCTATKVLVGNDQTGASNFSFGIDNSSSSSDNNSAGWPQDPNFSGTNFFPDNFRVWVR